jgi:hypothetical protein
MHRAHSTRAVAREAWIFNDRSLALALITSARDAEESLLKAYLAAAAAGRTGLRRSTRFGAVTAAGFARTMAGDFDFFFNSGNRFFKF